MGRLMVDSLMIGQKANYDLIPIWSHIMYIYLKLKYELKDDRLSNLLAVLTQMVGKWVLFFFILDTAYETPLTAWDLTKYCAIRSIAIAIKLDTEDLNKMPLVDWLVLSPEVFTGLHGYYEEKLATMMEDLPSSHLFRKIYSA